MANPFSLLGRLAPSARSVSLRALLLTGDGMPVQQALSQSLRNPELPLSVKRQATDLVYSVLRADIRLDFVLRRLFPRADRLPALFLLAVKTAACALLFEEHAPAHAIVNGTVSDVRRLFGKGLDRVANGALRSLQRMGSAPLSPDFYRLKGEADDFPALCRFYSLPEEAARLWLVQEGRETAIALMKKSFARPCAGIRVNSSRPGWENLRKKLLGAGALPLPGAAGESAGVYVPEGGLGLSGRMDLTSLQKDGALSFQQGASLCVMAETGLLRHDAPIWDACAGFGGKTTALIEAGRVVAAASDCSFSRLRHLPAECARLGIGKPLLFLADASCPPLAKAPGDVLLDVPCSGLGVLARRPDIRRRKQDFAAYAALQERILAKAAALSGKGASLFYMTCTVNREENEDVVRKAESEGLCRIEAEWKTPVDSPLEGMYGARLTVI